MLTAPQEEQKKTNMDNTHTDRKVSASLGGKSPALSHGAKVKVKQVLICEYVFYGGVIMGCFTFKSVSNILSTLTNR